jgi:hypothetical protein
MIDTSVKASDTGVAVICAELATSATEVAMT